MAAAFQQQIFALDARFNAYRAPNNPSFKTLYIRRRSQLLRENAKFKDIDTIKQYINIRSQLLQRRYGVQDNISISSSSSRHRSMSKANLYVEDSANKKKANELTISENYAFSGVHHIFDQHQSAVSVVKFAHNSRSRLACACADGSVSICDVTPPAAAAAPPLPPDNRVRAVLRGHTAAVTDCDWSSSNELLVSSGEDGFIRVWRAGDKSGSGEKHGAGEKSEAGEKGGAGGSGEEEDRLMRSVRDPIGAAVLACCFQPTNNNIVITGNSRGMVSILNVSTGIYPKDGTSIMGGQVKALVCESSGTMFWAGNDKGVILSYRTTQAGLSKLRRISVRGAVSSLSWSPWLARHPALLVNTTDNALLLYRVVDRDGSLCVRRRHPLPLRGGGARSTFCPIMSFRAGVCVVSAADDANVYFIDIENTAQPVLNKLQGHASPVLGVSFSYDESLLATSDMSGLVIIWRRS